jgi:hypothetical protein
MVAAGNYGWAISALLDEMENQQGKPTSTVSRIGPSDRDFLVWLHDRLMHVHQEPPNADYMHKLRAIIEKMPVEIATTREETQDV